MILDIARHSPVVLPVEGHECSRWNSRATADDLCSLAGAEFGMTLTEKQMPNPHALAQKFVGELQSHDTYKN
jgi:hypothetical protein